MSLKDGFPAVAQSSHPLILHKITQMRKVCHANKSDWWFLWLNGSVYKWEMVAGPPKCSVAGKGRVGMGVRRD